MLLEEELITYANLLFRQSRRPAHSRHSRQSPSYPQNFSMTHHCPLRQHSFNCFFPSETSAVGCAVPLVDFCPVNSPAFIEVFDVNKSFCRLLMYYPCFPLAYDSIL